ncbi:MAG: RagB/SusD family nutrient uptake outer membrane protein [Chitinophagaceae bacterium]|nr:RagB/SusD family nutrient uptake outer membrane protein [Chitinophagaceae bacterium]
MRIRTFLYNIGAGSLLLMGISCKKLIGIPPNPPTQITEAQQFSDSLTAMSAVAGVYTFTALGKGFTYNDGQLSWITGVSGDELIYTSSGNAGAKAFFDNGVTPINDELNSLWSGPYTGIYPVNVILERMASSTALSASFRKQVTAEMKVVRALYYFNLVNLFGPAPIVTASNYKVNAFLSRSSVDSVYDQVLSDLTESMQALTPDYPSAGHLRPNLYTAESLLAKVYLYRQQWQKAFDAANDVIESHVYTLEQDLNKVFLDGSTEAIWQIPTIGQYFRNPEAAQYIPQSPGSIPNYILSPALLNVFSPGDQRLVNWAQQVVINIDGTDKNFYYPYKYKNVYPGATVEDFMIFRLADVYLIRAEAAAHLDNTNQALADLKTVRERAGLGESTAATKDEVLAAVQKERLAELFTEWGNRWFDLKRTGTIDAVLGAAKPNWKPFCALYPVPRSQIILDPNLKQNPGYN